MVIFAVDIMAIIRCAVRYALSKVSLFFKQETSRLDRVITTRNRNTIYQALKGRCNVFVVRNKKECILIDTSVSRYWKELSAVIDSFVYQGCFFTGLILTHSHFDHVINAQLVRRKYKMKIHIREEERGLLSKGESPEIRGTNIVLGAITSLFQKQMQSLCKYQAVEPDVSVVDDKFSLESLGINAYLLHTPGHSAGSMSVIVDDEIALVGDTLVGMFPNFIYPPFAANPKLMIKSWEKLIDTNCRLFIPSHGRASTRDILIKQHGKYS